MPNVPTLSITPSISTAAPGWADAAASGSQVWNGHSGALIAKAMKKPRNSHFCTVGRQGDVRQRVEDERAVVPGDRRLARVHVQRDHRDQHEQAAEQAVEQELHRRVLPRPDAERPDHEVHRDQHGLEEHVEQEDVGGREDPDHHRVEHQHQREVHLRRPLTLGSSASCQEASITTGISTAVMPMSTSAIPSTPTA